MQKTLLIVLAIVLLAVGAVAALTISSGRSYVERNGTDEYGNIRGEQETGGFPGTPGYGNGTNLPGSPIVAPAPQPGDPGDGVACTADAMQCPDGSFVGRVPPSCAFATCPGR
jgi:hypothetical protein